MYDELAAAAATGPTSRRSCPNDLLVGAMIYHLLYDGAPPSSDEVQAMVDVILDGIRRREARSTSSTVSACDSATGSSPRSATPTTRARGPTLYREAVEYGVLADAGRPRLVLDERAPLRRRRLPGGPAAGPRGGRRPDRADPARDRRAAGADVRSPPPRRGRRDGRPALGRPPDPRPRHRLARRGVRGVRGRDDRARAPARGDDRRAAPGLGRRAGDRRRPHVPLPGTRAQRHPQAGPRRVAARSGSGPAPSRRSGAPGGSPTATWAAAPRPRPSPNAPPGSATRPRPSVATRRRSRSASIA